MKQLSKELFEKYEKNPIACDEEVRSYCKLREDRYYTVSVYPEHLAGRVFETNNTRIVKSKKISKSDQK